MIIYALSLLNRLAKFLLANTGEVNSNFKTNKENVQSKFEVKFHHVYATMILDIKIINPNVCTL